jgi:hypothetical protein
VGFGGKPTLEAPTHTAVNGLLQNRELKFSLSKVMYFAETGAGRFQSPSA